MIGTLMAVLIAAQTATAPIVRVDMRPTGYKPHPTEIGLAVTVSALKQPGELHVVLFQNGAEYMGTTRYLKPSDRQTEWFIYEKHFLPPGRYHVEVWLRQTGKKEIYVKGATLYITGPEVESDLFDDTGR